MSTELEALEQRVGRSETCTDTFGPAPARALNASLDRQPLDFRDGTPPFPLWHGLCFLPLHLASEIGSDGHARRCAGATRPSAPARSTRSTSSKAAPAPWCS
jgi:3-methylfumaryl-CoA hydratase